MVATGLLNHPFKEAYASKVGALPGATHAWVDALRQTARAALNTAGLPGPKSEAFKFTPVNDLAKIPFVPAGAVDDVDVQSIPSGVPQIADAKRIVLVNGVINAALSDKIDIAGLTVESFKAALARDAATLKPVLGGLAAAASSPLIALNTAYMADGLVIKAAKNFTGATLHIISIGAAGAEPVAFHPRNIVALEVGAQLTLIESHVGLPGQNYLSNPVTEISLDENAQLKRYVSVAEDGDAFHFATTSAALAAYSTLESFYVGLSGGKVRQEIRTSFNGQGASAIVNSVYALTDKQHHDFTTAMDHVVPHTSSTQLVKGVVDGQSHAVFQGRVLVAKDAQKTDARQLHKAMFLSKGPAVDCKPELEIFADDVQCAHGAATGELDENHLFYLMARGIDADTARALLVAGFLEDAVSSISTEAVRAAFSEMVQSWLKRRGARSAA
jgi:Fe-S cluster assembly protein SufD